jgi:signal transduction histidine kinase
LLCSVPVKLVKAYILERRRRMQRRTLAAILLAIGLVPAFGVVDYLMYPASFPALMTGRLVSGACSAGLLFLLLRTRFGRRQPSWIAAALVLQTGAAIAVLPAYLTGTDTQHYVSAALLILSVSALMPWTARQVFLLTTSLATMFVVAGALHGEVTSQVSFATQVSAILVTGLLGGVISYLSERSRFNELVARRELRTTSREKTHLIRHLESVSGQLVTANEDLIERQRETNDFLYVLSHDLRAPLINIQGFGKRLHADMAGLESALGNADTDEARRRLGRMQQSLQFLNAGAAKIDLLIARLLEIARLATRPDRQEWVDTEEMLRNVLDAHRFQLEAAHVDVSVGHLPRVWGDPVQLSQVFANLIDNAVKYMGDRVERHVRIECTTVGDRFCFAVRDTGPGIGAKDQEKIFRLFARLSPNGVAGEGVGLAMVRAIINRHGGRIWVESTPGEGSTFFFTLPRDAERARTITATAAGTRHQTAVGSLGEERTVHVH